jgi:putative flippase GtrA
MTRWAVFNTVGVAGFVVQLAMLRGLLGAGLPLGAATALAVLAALSHNFVWHEAVTWRELPRHGRAARWLGFHATNGAVSLGTNVVVTTGLVTATPLPPLAANAVAVAAASTLNYLVSDRIVFRSGDAT